MGNKILFVEDEEDLALIVADTLRGPGYFWVVGAVLIRYNFNYAGSGYKGFGVGNTDKGRFLK